MDDERLPKRLFYGDVAMGSRRQGGQIRRYKDTLKSSLKRLQINADNWEELALDRPTWRRTVKTGVAIYEANRIAAAKAKREARKSQLRPVIHTFAVSRSRRADLKSHDRQLGHTCVRTAAVAHAAIWTHLPPATATWATRTPPLGKCNTRTGYHLSLAHEPTKAAVTTISGTLRHDRTQSTPALALPVAAPA
nr:unnamed protein product [Spirometra erinaceieuropaei]